MYKIWDRVNHEEIAIDEEKALEICQSSPCDSGPYGWMGTAIDQVLYYESDDDDDEAAPELMAVRHKKEWLTIPGHQAVFIEHELGEHGFDM